MSISFKTDHQRTPGGLHKYTITVETDIKRYFDSIQQLARECVDDSTQAQSIVTPVMNVTNNCGTSSRIHYACSWCECDITPTNRGFFVYCPRCGKKIDYSAHNFLKEELNAIR